MELVPLRLLTLVALLAVAAGCDTEDGPDSGKVDVEDDTDDGCDESLLATFYADSDGDGFGDAGSTVEDCAAPAGYVDNADDCDDAQPAAWPGATESCDDVDNDCDGEIDEAGATGEGTWYGDADTDGYGDLGTATIACDPPAGTVPNGDDCDDADAGVNPGATDTCNGLDDDCDERVDEDSADLDGDGVQDCFDDACVVGSATGGTTPVDDTCLAPDLTVADPWNAIIEWQWVHHSSSTYASHSYVTPKVGNLTDTDGDGDVDTDDIPNVLVSTFGDGGRLTLLTGDSGAEVWSITGVHDYGETAIADVDGDGANDVLAFDSRSQPILLDATGAVIWTASAATRASFPMITVADVDGDGVVEVITGTEMFDGLTGAVETTFALTPGILGYGPAVGDIDLDGQQEIIIGNAVYAPDGTLEWSSSVVGTYGHWSAIVDVDADPEGEVLMVGGGQLVVHDDDGAVLASTTTTAAARPGPICVADFDGDGTVEAAWGSESVFSVFELDGTLVWSSTIEDASGLAGCSAYDFDGDGVYEALIADEHTFRIFDGATGTVRFSQDGHASGTIFEYPVVADVDNDGSAEILYVSNFFDTDGATLHVLGHASGEWPRSGSTWPIHDFSATNVEADGSVPTDPTPAWQIYNVYRARPSVDTAAANLLVAIVDACASSCDDAIGTVSVSVEVSNPGSASISDEVTLVLYDADTNTALDSVPLAGGLASGEVSASVELTAALADVGAGGVYVRVDDDGLGGGFVDECDESDNSADWSGPVCP